MEYGSTITTELGFEEAVEHTRPARAQPMTDEAAECVNAARQTGTVA